MKNKVFPTLTTPYVEKMDKNTPWNEYPRPSMVRGSFLCLNGTWDFGIAKKGCAPEYTDKILVPFPPESLLSGYEKRIPKKHLLHYRRTFTLPDDFIKERVILHFGAVDAVCDVYLNGTSVAHHEGGYLPFSADITDVLARGEENVLTLQITDDISPKYPYGKQTHKRHGMWYTPVSGIWQTVWLESVPKNHIERIKITPTTKDVLIEVVGGTNEKVLTLEDGSVYKFSGMCVTVTPREPILWTPETPHLYSFTLESGEDKIESYFALREIGSKTVNGIPRLTLNGKPYLFSALLDQGYFPDGIFLPATSEGYLDDIRAAKEMGFNTLRKHIKIEPEIFYNLCDRMGMVVFQDMVNNGKYSFFFDTALPTVGMKRFTDTILHRNKETRDIFINHTKDTLRHLYNFPSILYYTVFNEGWGQFCADAAYDFVKSIDSTRIVDTTSGWFQRNKSDVDSRHVYFKPVTLTKRDGRPIVISEFGGYSHRVTEHLFGTDNYGYRVFDERKDFEDAFTTLHTDEILPLIDKGICALVYTQLSDIEDETNGLLTYDRRVTKVERKVVFELMQKLYSKMAESEE